MVIEAPLLVILAIVKGLLSMIPSFSWSLSNTAFGTFLDIVSSVCYLLPMGTITTIIGLSISLTIVKAVIALIKTIWDLLPFV